MYKIQNHSVQDSQAQCARFKSTVYIEYIAWHSVHWVDVFTVYVEYVATTQCTLEIIIVHCKKIFSMYTVLQCTLRGTVYTEWIFLQCTLSIWLLFNVHARYSLFTVKTSTQCTLRYWMYSMYTVLLNVAYKIDWSCFDYSLRNSRVALLEALFDVCKILARRGIDSVQDWLKLLWLLPKK